MSSSVATSAPFPGAARFEVRERLGSGGFGEVYRAYDTQRGMEVAVKVLQAGDGNALYRFKREFRALADVAHPNLVGLYELLLVGDRWLLTMELVRGSPFLAYVHAGENTTRFESTTRGRSDRPPAAADETIVVSEPRPWQAAAEGSAPVASMPRPIDLDRLRDGLAQLAEGLVALHDAGKLHCDIKPSNVLVDDTGRVVLLDFGVVVELRHQGLDEISGTPAYMSPEQAAGAALGPASDWYSVGVMLYEALTGRRPIEASAEDLLTLKQHLDPLSPTKLMFGPDDRAASPELRAAWPADLAELCEAMLRRDPAARPGGREVLRRLGVRPQRRQTREVPLDTALLGRDSELARLDAAWERVPEAGSVVVVVSGASGIGKTALVEHFAATRSDAVVLRGRCHAAESVPYQGVDSVIDELSRHLRRLDDHDARRLVGDGGADLRRLFPVLRQVPAIADAGDGEPAPDAAGVLRQRAFTALRDLIVRLSKTRPVLMFIDDTQWSDADGATLLADLLRPPGGPSMMLVLGRRFGDQAASPMEAELRRLSEPPIETLEVCPLSVAHSRGLARTLAEEGGLPPSRVAALAADAAGSPFFLVELVRYLTARPDQPEHRRGGTSVDDMVRARVAALPTRVRRLLEAVAIAGHPITIRAAAAACDADEAIQPSVKILRAAHLIRASGLRQADRLEPYHDRIRQAIDTGLEVDVRRRWHGALARALESTGDGDAPALARHFFEARQFDKAAQYMEKAAAAARDALAFDRAARLLGEAVELRGADGNVHHGLLERWADALADAGQGAAAAEAYLRAAKGRPSIVALELRRRASEQWLRSGRIDDGLRSASEVLESLGMSLPSTPAKAVASLLWQRTKLRLRGLRFTARRAEEISPTSLLEIDASFSISLGLGIVDPSLGACYQTRNLLDALDAGEPSRVARAMAFEAAYAGADGKRGWDRAQRLLTTVRGLADDSADPRARAYANLAHGVVLHLNGHFEPALRTMDEVEQHLQRHCPGLSWETNSARFFALDALRWLGRWSEIGERIPTLLIDAQRRGDLYAEAVLRAKSMWIRLGRDDPDGAAEDVEHGLVRWNHPQSHMQRYWMALGSGEIALYRGDAEAALAAIDDEWPALRRSFLLYILFLRLEAHEFRGRAAVAAAAATSDGSRRARLLAMAAESARVVRRHVMHRPWSVARASLISAGIASVEAKWEVAQQRLVDARAQAADASLRLTVAAATWRLGRALGGDEGQDLQRVAAAEMKAAGIVAPGRLVAMLAPGAWPR